MAFYPLAGAALGPPLDPVLFRSDTASSFDFDGVGKGESRHRGAFATPDPEGRWRIQRGIKPASSR
jgi:hypothetical protein